MTRREPIEYARKLIATLGQDEAEALVLHQHGKKPTGFMVEAYAALLELAQPRDLNQPLAGIPRTFYLGAAPPQWLATSHVPLFVARQSLAGRKALPRAKTHWALDSGGFTELQKHGRWTVDVREYVAQVRRFHDEIGLMDFAASQDWMCEPIVLAGGKTRAGKFAGTKLSVPEHIERTVQNFLDLKSAAPDLPWMPTLQGWNVHDYRACAELYSRYGVKLEDEERVGLGSVCRREDVMKISLYVNEFGGGPLARRMLSGGKIVPGLRLHGFGIKTEALPFYTENYLVSADSQAWSMAARFRRREMAGCCEEGKKVCNNCFHWALEWRALLLKKLGPDWQLDG